MSATAHYDEFSAIDFQHVAQLLRSTDEKVVRASLSNWLNAIIAALDFAASYEPTLTAAKADEIYSSQLMRKFRDTLSYVKDGLEDEGDRIYFGSTNDADQLREITDEIEELEWDRILASSQKKPDLYARTRELNNANRLMLAALTNIAKRISNNGSWTLDDACRETAWIQAEARAALSKASANSIEEK